MRILAVGKQRNMATSGWVRVPVKDRFKKEFLFFMKRGNDGNRAFEFGKQSLEEAEAMVLCPHIRGAG